jgi:hypothetical protein
MTISGNRSRSKNKISITNAVSEAFIVTSFNYPIVSTKELFHQQVE